MSETTDPQGGAAAAAEPAAPAETTTEAPAPAETGAAETGGDNPEQPKPSRADRRIAALSARLSAGEQERARLAAELDAYRRQANPAQPPQPPRPEDIPRLVEERVGQELTQRMAQERAQTFHEQGRAAFPDWADRCQSLMQMGADPQLAELLIETPGGPKVAAALADDPEEMERIAGLKTERARAIALGRYAAGLEASPGRAPARPTSRAPEPIRPVGNGAARVTFNEQTATTQQLVDYYARQAMERRNAR